jgi:hypothetical protein
MASNSRKQITMLVNTFYDEYYFRPKAAYRIVWRPSSIVTSRASTLKPAPSCSSAPNATKQQGSQSLKGSAIREHETQGKSLDESSLRRTKDEKQGEDAWGSLKEKSH